MLEWIKAGRALAPATPFSLWPWLREAARRTARSFPCDQRWPKRIGWHLGRVWPESSLGATRKIRNESRGNRPVAKPCHPVHHQERRAGACAIADHRPHRHSARPEPAQAKTLTDRTADDTYGRCTYRRCEGGTRYLVARRLAGLPEEQGPAQRVTAPWRGNCLPPCRWPPDRRPCADLPHRPVRARPAPWTGRPCASCHPDRTAPVPARPPHASTSS